MAFLDQIYPINGMFDQIHVHKPEWNNMSKPLEKKIDHFPKPLAFYAILPHNLPYFHHCQLKLAIVTFLIALMLLQVNMGPQNFFTVTKKSLGNFHVTYGLAQRGKFTDFWGHVTKFQILNNSWNVYYFYFQFCKLVPTTIAHFFVKFYLNRSLY